MIEGEFLNGKPNGYVRGFSSASGRPVTVSYIVNSKLYASENDYFMQSNFS